MKQIYGLMVILLIQSVYAEDSVINELNAAWNKLEQTVSNGDFRSFKSVFNCRK